MSDRSYALTRRHWGSDVEVPISAEDFAQLTQARALLIDGLSFEQRYELVLANWLALESAASTWSMQARIGTIRSIDASLPIFSDANRHVMNLMAIIRSYADQVVQEFQSANLSEPFGAQAKAQLRKAYDDSLGYRMVALLRNHVQHFGMPVHKFGVNSHAERDAWSESSSIFVTKELVAEDPTVNRTKLREMPDDLDLRLACRDCVQHLSVAHIALRKIVTRPVNEARERFERAIDRYVAAGGRAIGLQAACVTGATTSERPVMIILEWDELRRKLVDKNIVAISVGKGWRVAHQSRHPSGIGDEEV